MPLAEFIPGFATLTAFTLAAILLSLTPGPDMTLFLGKAVTAGRAAGLAAFFGAITGLVGHTLLAAFGISALLAASPKAFLVLKIVGSLYLLWLAYVAIRKGSGLTLAGDEKIREPLRAVFLAGLAINLLNPKIILFFVTFLPQFVSADDPNAAGTLLFLGVYFIVLSVPVCVPMILAADRIAARIKKTPWMIRAIDWTFAGVMSAFAVKLLVSRAV